MSKNYRPDTIGVHIFMELVPDRATVQGHKQAIFKVHDDVYRLSNFLAIECGANVLDVKVHEFPGGGYTGFILLAESHLAIHTWPEKEYAALDIFGCRKEFTDRVLAKLPSYLRSLSFFAKTTRVHERGPNVA